MTRTVSEERRIGPGDVIPRPVEAAAQAVVGDDLVPLMPTLLATARYLMRSEAEARDLTQTTLEIALRRLHQLRDSEKLRPWLLAILTREALRLRRRLGRLVRFEPAIREIRLGPSADDSRLALRQALAGLPPRMRAAIVLHHMAGLSVAETASAMDVSPNTIKSELKAGLRRLREGLDDRTD